MSPSGPALQRLPPAASGLLGRLWMPRGKLTFLRETPSLPRDGLEGPRNWVRVTIWPKHSTWKSGIFFYLKISYHNCYCFNHFQCLAFFSLRTSVTKNPWVRLAAGMLTRCPGEPKAGLGSEVLELCRSLYNTSQRLPAEVSACPCPRVPSPPHSEVCACRPLHVKDLQLPSPVGRGTRL